MTKPSLPFQQKAKIGVAGNLINQLMANNTSLPKVGEGATQLHYSDRTCFEVIEVSRDYKTVKLEYLNAKADLSKPHGYGEQNWLLEPTGSFITVVWRHNKWKVKGNIVQFTEAFRNQFPPNTPLYNKLTPGQYQHIYGEQPMPNQIWDGITENKTTYSEIKLIFGVKDYRYDWEF